MMKIPALRSIAKINSNVFKNSCRLFSYRFEMTPATRPATDHAEQTTKPASEEPPKSIFRYNVCQPRTSTLERPSIGDIGNHQNETVKTAIEKQQLQPSMLPEYFQRQMEKNVLVNPDPEISEEMRINQRQQSQNQRRFQVSKTCANATLPLKSVKLANPFPEPVKIMPSRTVADDEKAEQMLAESKSQMNTASVKPSNNFRSFSTIKRWYSKTVAKDPKRCKKMGKGKPSCPRMTLPCCPPRARMKCDRLAKSRRCKKQDAPYPAYSEFCHEDIEEKPSECKLCPWKPEDNPNFKPQKKNLHTATHPMLLRRSGLEMDYQKKDETMEKDEANEGMQCDLRKPQCERPKNRRCPPSKDKKKEDKKKKPPKKCDGFADVLEPGPIPVEEIQPSLFFADKCKKPKEKCKKFKFPVEQIERKPLNRCPKKKKKPKIRDCPGPCGGGCKTTLGEALEEYSLSENRDRDQKCPNVDMTVDKGEMEDRCKKRRPEGTLKCPADLLKKKTKKPGKPKRKTSGIITPTESKIDMPQPQPTKTV